MAEVDNPSCDLRVYFDGACPLCSREIHWLRRRIPEGSVAFKDISQSDFVDVDEARSKGRLMEEFHAQLPSGEWVTGMEAFRRLYDLAGVGYLLRPTGWPVLRSVFDAAYALFAKYRLALTSRRGK